MTNIESEANPDGETRRPGSVTFCLTQTLLIVGWYGEKIEGGKVESTQGRGGDRCECWLPSVF